MKQTAQIILECQSPTLKPWIIWYLYNFRASLKVLIQNINQGSSGKVPNLTDFCKCYFC